MFLCLLLILLVVLLALLESEILLIHGANSDSYVLLKNAEICFVKAGFDFFFSEDLYVMDFIIFKVPLSKDVFRILFLTHLELATCPDDRLC